MQKYPKKNQREEEQEKQSKQIKVKREPLISQIFKILEDKKLWQKKYGMSSMRKSM